MRLDRQREDRRTRLVALARGGVLAVSVLAVLPIPVLADDPSAPPTDPSPTTEPTPTPEPEPIIERVLIYDGDAVVRQYGGSWCVAAATQTMWNLVKKNDNRRYARQRKLYRDIRRHNRYKYKTLGNDIQGWAWGLRDRTGIPFQPRSYATKSGAIAAIVEALDRTKRPVGITVWRGTHAWVVLGYRVTVDPVDPSRREILGFYVNGPLGPKSKDPWKYAYYPMASFKKVYTKYHEWQRKVIWEGRYVLVSA